MMVSRFQRDWQDKGHSVKSALLAKAVSNPALMLPELTWPGSPGMGWALPLAARQWLPGTLLLHQQWWQLEEKYSDTSKMVIWKAKCEHSYYHLHKFGSAARLRPSSSDLSSLQHHHPLSVLKLSFRPLPRVVNGVIYSSCTHSYPLSPMKLEKINIGI